MKRFGDKFKGRFLGSVSDTRPNGTGEKLNLKHFLNLSVGSAIYGVTTLELIVQRNRSNVESGEGAWGFGQILSLVLILQSVVDSLVTLHEWRKRSKVDEGV